MVLGKVGSSEPDVGDQLVGGGGGDQQPISLYLLQVVDVGSPGNGGGKVLVGIEGRGSLKGSRG